MRGFAVLFSVILKISQVFDRENKHNVSSLLSDKMKRSELFPSISVAKLRIIFHSMNNVYKNSTLLIHTGIFQRKDF